MRRVHVLISGGAVLGLAGLLLGSGSGGGGEKMEIDGPSATEVAAFASLADSVQIPEPKPPALPASDQVDFDHIERVGDHYEAPLRGSNRHAILTLDPKLQTAAEKLLTESRAPRGGIVAMTPDGKILALAGRRASEDGGSLDGTFDWHLAVDAWAPTASVFKLVTASALVNAGVKPDDEVCFHGGIRSVLESNLRDDKRDNQCKDLSFGVAHSNNAILGKLAFQHLEPAELSRFAHDLGFDRMLLGAPMGSLAIPSTKDLEFAKAAAGFSGSQMSAIGGAVLAATFANEGEQPTPYIIESIVPAADVPRLAKRRAISADIARTVRKMMIATCESGSASKSFRHRAVHVAGKTGTLTRTEPLYMEHSWFVGYAPVEAPEIVISVVLGNPENWHLRGHEAAKRLLDKAIAAPSAKDRSRS
jgi:cell division protein FtsI/penicillin-binding protein 2